MGNHNASPNVIVFFTDQQRWDTTGAHDNPLGLTPNFDRMAAQGTHVYNSFTCQPVCGPARSCLQTGLYATASGCFKNGVPLPGNVKTLAAYFKEAGYRTGYIGKWHLASQNPVPENERGGYEYWLASNSLEHTSDAYDTVVYDHDNRPVKLPGYRVDALTDAAIRYIHDHRHDPFFLFVSYLEPHHQNHLDSYPAPDGYAERYTGAWIPPDLAALGGNAYQQLGGYYGMVKRLDEALGRMQDALKSLDLSKRTIVLFTSDHGCHFKTRNNEYKRTGHESSIRVPTAICGPGFNGGRRLQELVSLIDLPPTLLDAAGLPVPESMQGRSILPLLRGEADQQWPEEVLIQISESQVGRALRTERWKYGIVAPDQHGMEHPAAEVYAEAYLYDLHADPYELTNLIGCEAFKDTTEHLRTALLRKMLEAGEGEATIEPAPQKRCGQRHVHYQSFEH